MIKHTQTICRLLPTNCLSVFDYFVGLALKGLNFKLLGITFYEQRIRTSGYIFRYNNYLTVEILKDNKND